MDVADRKCCLRARNRFAIDFIDVYVGYDNFGRGFPPDAQPCAERMRARRFFKVPGAQLVLTDDGFIQYFAHDSAFIELERPLDFGKPCLCAVCVEAWQHKPRLYEQCVAAGFGYRDACDTVFPPALTWIKLIFDFTQAKCDALLMPLFDESFYCLTPAVVGAGNCEGDSGSGLLCYDAERKRHVISGTFTGGDHTANACCDGAPVNGTIYYFYKGNYYVGGTALVVSPEVYEKVDAILQRRAQLLVPEIALE